MPAKVKTKTVKKKAKKLKTYKDLRVTADMAFYVCDGQVFYTISELRDGLKLMEKGVFDFHVNKEKNDFYNWIKHVFQYDTLATEVKRAKTAKGIHKILIKTITE
jgi:hypothetical protein